jgi:transposase-like protein
MYMDVSLVRSEVAMMPLEREAVYLLNIEIEWVPSLVQTGDYARAVAKSIDLPAEQIEPWVESRLARQFTLTRDKPPQLDMVVDEAVFRKVVGDRQIMARQLRAILEACDRDNVELRVLPVTPFWLESGYYVMAADFSEHVAYLENPTSVVIVDDRNEMEFYRQCTSRLARRSLEPDESLAIVAAYAKEYEVSPSDG